MGDMRSPPPSPEVDKHEKDWAQHADYYFAQASEVLKVLASASHTDQSSELQII